MVFQKNFFAQNEAKIIVYMIQGTKRVFYYQIQELVNPTKLNLVNMSKVSYGSFCFVTSRLRVFRS